MHQAKEKVTSSILLQEKGYLIVRRIVTDEVLSRLSDAAFELKKNGEGIVDSFVKNSFYLYKYPLFESLLESLLPIVENIVGQPLYKTYSYIRHYKIGNELPPHRDREACEYTLSIPLWYENQPWPLWIQDKANMAQSFILEPGDAMIFKGIELLHWRDINTYGNCSQLFLHYVGQNGPYANYKDDNENAK